MSAGDPLPAPMVGAVHEDFAGIQADVVLAGQARVERLIYSPGTRWSTHVRPIVGGDWCMHSHAFLARRHLRGQYDDRCRFDFPASAGVVIEAGHDAWVIGDEPAVLIQFDFRDRDAHPTGCLVTRAIPFPCGSAVDWLNPLDPFEGARLKVVGRHDPGLRTTPSCRSRVSTRGAIERVEAAS